MQTFLASLGFSSNFIYIHATLIQAANTLTIVLCPRWADRGIVMKRAAMAQIPHAVLYLLYVPLCIHASSSIKTFVALTVISVFQAIAIGLYTVCEYKVPYQAYSPENYGIVLALSGILSSVLTFGVGSIVSALAKQLEYSEIMYGAAVMSSGLGAISCLSYFSQKRLHLDFAYSSSDGVQRTLPLKDVMLQPVFRDLIPANLMRGFAHGTVAIAATIAIDLGFQEHVATTVISAQSAAMLIGCGAFGVLSRCTSPRLPVILGSCCYLVFPLSLLLDEKIFLLVVIVVFLGRTIVDFAVPTLLRYVVPEDIAGPYNAWRMILHSMGMIISTLVATVLSTQALIILAAVCQFSSGCFYAHLRATEITLKM